MADEGDELAAPHDQVEAVDHRERALGRLEGLPDLEELDVAVLDRRCRCRLVGLGWPRLLGERDHARHRRLRRRAAPGRDAGKSAGDVGPKPLEGGIGVQRGAVAGPVERHPELGAERGVRAGPERDDAVGEEDRLVDVIGDQHHRLPLRLPDRGDLVLELGAGQRVERRERLVEEEEVGLRRQGACHGDALAHAAGQLRRPAVTGVIEADEGDVAVDPRLARGAALLGEERIDRERDVALDRQPRHQRIGLEHDPDARRRPVDLPAAEDDAATVGSGQSRDRRDQRRLAGPGEADDGDELALLDLEVDAAEHVAARRALAVGFGQPADFEKRHRRPPTASPNT